MKNTKQISLKKLQSITKDLLLSDEVKITPKEWSYLALKEMGKEEFIPQMIGSPVTIWRIKKSLKEKGYL